MKRMTTRNIAAVATLLGVSLLMSAPAVQADQGKWWQPKESRRGETRQRGGETRNYRSGQRGGETRNYRSGQRSG